MTKAKLSDEAKTALMSATSSTQGARVPGGTAAGRLELAKAGLMTPLGHLTRRGSIERERLVTAELDAAF